MKKMKFIVMNPTAPRDATGESALTLKNILSTYSLPVAILPSLALTFKEKNSSYCEAQTMDVLTVEDTYEEDFLLGHPIEQGDLLIKTPIVIPMYMKHISLVMAEGFLQGDLEKWNTLCNFYDKQVQSKGNMEHYKLEEIMLLDKNDISKQQNLYNEVEPIYIDLNLFMEPKFEEYALDNFSEESKAGVTAEVVLPPLIPSPVMPTIPVSKNQRIQHIKEIPKDLHHLDVEEVCDCLCLLNMNQYREAFREGQIDGQLLFDLDQEMMQKCLGMNNLHIAKLLKFRDGWRPNVKEETS
ncbi:uncharacterized protein LOC115075287 isoform X2 [Rhinatrema bivittatum]|nr:uncharacterized protein LOC115075287 isoform X2 [Rhinatrema bivittatum]